MEFLKLVKRRSFLNELLYVLLNVGMAIAILVIIKVTGSVFPAFILVLLSKWRVLAVRSRFWAANIQANLVSVIVDFSYIIILYKSSLSSINSTQNFIFQAILVTIYVFWLLYLRPKSKRVYVVAQAGLAVFAGITAIYAITYGWIASPVVLLVWLVGYATARHVLSSYEEDHLLFLSLVWGLVIAEIGWLAYHWTVAYRLPFITNLMLPQVSIIILCVSFLAYKSYDSFIQNGKIKLNDIILPLIFTISTVSVLLLAFNGVSSNI
ncbi:hypothetical protein CVV43_01125 [Candidatus Saccharibacteria bacterium HGW-Saccharibacteria-1]|jgi:hypothetical protein|nr:MAG: hypothetical protein CVV43_01125 [Candidatus Saccharibacteria bacterium HGW-Saccharibacteria-1]